jgi:hypothetical protein
MREVADTERIHRLIRSLGAEADEEGAAYFTGGATAVLLGWRALIDRELVAPTRVLGYFEEIEPELYRFPALDPRGFRERVEEVLGAL